MEIETKQLQFQSYVIKHQVPSTQCSAIKTDLIHDKIHDRICNRIWDSWQFGPLSQAD